MKDLYSSFAELEAKEREGRSFSRVATDRRNAAVAIIAPHAGAIEPMTGTLARRIAGDEFSLYVFKGARAELHITSTRFDEPRAVRLVRRNRWVVAIHGCRDPGDEVLLGGRDVALVRDIERALRAVSIQSTAKGHAHTGLSLNNIVNRGKSAAGAQLELTRRFRRGSRLDAFVAAVRQVLLERQIVEQASRARAD